MNRFCQGIVGSVAVLFSCHALATTEIDCPPTPMISNTSFTSAQQYEQVWILLSTLNYKDVNWSVMFGLAMPEMKSSDQALQQGQEYFNTKVNLNNPHAAEGGGFVACVYATADDYAVIAINADVPGYATKFMKKFA